MSDTHEISEELRRIFPRFYTGRLPHRCRLCNGEIPPKEPRCRWRTVERGEGWRTWHAHPECYQVTLDEKWDDGDWESVHPGDMERPKRDE